MVEGLVMEITESKLWMGDIDEVIGTLPELKELSGKSVMVTGSTGLICSAFIDLLARYNETTPDKIYIVAAGRDINKAKNRFARFVDNDWFEILRYDALLAENEIERHMDYVVHGAGNAAPGKIVSEPVETMLGNFMGTYRLLEKARQGLVGRLLFISSSEVYGKSDSEKPLEINEYGYIDLLNYRNSYSIGKSAAETLCVSYAEEYGVDPVIVRPGHVYGPTASRADNRVASLWAYMAAEGKDIVMKSDGAQLRSYCYVLDCASAIVKVLIKGKTGCAYNISNPASVITIKELAKIYAKVTGVNLLIEMPSEAEKKGFNPMKNSSLDASELIALGWNGVFDANRGLAHTVEIMIFMQRLVSGG